MSMNYWQCDRCNAYNAARLTECAHCHAPRRGEWLCPKGCGLQWAHRKDCEECGSPRPDSPTGRRPAAVTREAPTPCVDPSEPPDARKGRSCARGAVKLTKAEAEYLEIMRASGEYDVVRPHALTVVFGDGTRYTPDVIAWVGRDLYAIEVKGGYRGPGWEQGYERFRRAREQFPWMRLAMASRQRDGSWRLE